MGNGFLIWLLISLVAGLICAFFAKEKGRNTTAWFVAGFIGSLVTLIIINAISKKKN